MGVLVEYTRCAGRHWDDGTSRDIENNDSERVRKNRE